MKCVVVIPAYQPDESLFTLVQQLNALHFSMIIVNDGSDASCAQQFANIAYFENVTVLHHAVNLGKGQALKTAFNYFLTHYSSAGVITVDADGQHCIDDIQRIAQHFSCHPLHLCLGIREFGEHVPWKSKFGNNLTRFIFKMLIRKELQDTQTGLRAIPRQVLQSLLKMKSGGYDFELDMLIYAANNMIIDEVPIQTIYKNDNKGSHFNPIIDSLKIYFVFLRYLTFSLVSGCIDFVAFSLAFLFTHNVLLSESLARLISGTGNFLLNKELVFKSKHKILPEALKYALLCLINLVFSYSLIFILVFLGANVFFSKLAALIGLFFANFAIQKILIFEKEDEVTAKTIDV